MAHDPYSTSHIKRARATRAEMEARREALFDIVAADKPMTVRQVFYQATAHELVGKSEAGYAKVQADLHLMADLMDRALEAAGEVRA